MKKTAALAAILLYAAMLIVTVSAQTATPEPNSAANIFGTIIAIIALIIVLDHCFCGLQFLRSGARSSD
jgi:flagellar biogenesis protein FliO